jgi:hypothetical protein
MLFCTKIVDEISELLVKNAAARSAAKNCSYAVMTLLQLTAF